MSTRETTMKPQTELRQPDLDEVRTLQGMP